MTVAVDGVARYHWPVSTGIPSRETPNGAFRAFRMEEDHYSKEFDDAPMPHAIFFTKVGHAIHGTDSVDRLGPPASHGCVRLSRQHASTLYALVQQQGVLNATVTLTGSWPRLLWRATRGPHPHGGGAPRAAAGRRAAYDSAGDPVGFTPRRSPPRCRPRADNGYIYPADGTTPSRAIPRPPAAAALYDAQANQQQQQQYYPIKAMRRPRRVLLSAAPAILSAARSEHLSGLATADLLSREITRSGRSVALASRRSTLRHQRVLRCRRS